MSRRLPTFTFAIVGLCALGLAFAFPPATHGQGIPLNPLTLTKYIDPLPIPGSMPAAGPNYYEIGMYPVVQQLHSQLPPTQLWGYGTSQATASYPAATIEAIRDVPISVLWTNHLPEEHLLGYAIDYTLHMVGYHMGMPTGEWTSGIPTVVHVHGGEVAPQSDGGPDAWFTQGFNEVGKGWTGQIYHYPNAQLPATIWYHDHALGITRLNVYAGLAGFYLIRDPSIEGPLNLPSGPYEIPLVIQDRMFDTNGQLFYPTGGDNPEIHPIWQPEFFGDVVLANGKVWPYLEVEPRKYRFRMLNGSNARFYAMQLVEDATQLPGPGFWQIGSDGGYLDSPVLIASPAIPGSPRLVMAPGERADVIIDFSAYAPGTTFTLRNNAKSPFPNGAVVDPKTTGQIMQFRVKAPTAPDLSAIATPGPGYVERLTGATRTRTLTLDETMGPNGPIMALLNNTMWDADVTEIPDLGSTEIWRIVNTTGDAHPIHLHLTQFQLVSRQKFKVSQYNRAYMGGGMGMPAPDVTPYLTGKPQPAPPEEAGWKDTFKMYPGEVTTVIVRFAPQDGDAAFEFDATAEPGYVWHCHILEHEDNEMMRPYKLQAPLVAQSRVAGTNALRAADVRTRLTVSPNPLTTGARVEFRLALPGRVLLAVYGVDGRRVRTLADGTYEAGRWTLGWDGTDARGDRVASGVYFLRLEGDGIREHTRVVVAR